MTRPASYHLTKIVATLGPASDSKDMIAQLVDAGADVFRLNFSHGTHERHELVLRLIRKVEEEKDRPIGVIADLQGPKLRVGSLPAGGVPLVSGEEFILRLGEDDGTEGDERGCCLPHPEIHAVAEEGTELLLDDGRLSLLIKRKDKDALITEVKTGGLLKPRKGVNYPARRIPLSALTAKDREDLAFALEREVDWVALSFVQEVKDIEEAKQLIDGRAKVIAKIEKPQAVENFDAIAAAADGIMIARGDLGVELEPERVPALQKQMVAKCRVAGRPVIVATQMLESMTSAARPTRAETSDVATALYDGTDAVMLSAESASGEYPREAVEFMRRILISTEADPEYRRALERATLALDTTAPVAIVAAACRVAEVVQASAIISFSKTGSTTLRASQQRPVCPLLGLSPLQRTARMATLCWGVRSIRAPDLDTDDDMVAKATAIALKYGFAAPGDMLAITAGVPFGTPGKTNLLRLAEAKKDEGA